MYVMAGGFFTGNDLFVKIITIGIITIFWIQNPNYKWYKNKPNLIKK